MHLGLAEGELERLTLAELGALNEAYAEREKRSDWRCAMIVATLANVNRGSKDDPVLQPHEIMPWLAEEKKKVETKRQPSPELMRAVLEDLTLSLGGTIKKRPES